MSYVLMMGMTIGIVAVYAVILVLYLNAEKKNDGTSGFRRATGLKLTLSGLFCLAGVVSYYALVNGNSLRSDLFFNMQLLIVLGLFAAVGGDFFLQYIRRDNQKYRIGIGCFMATQILFLVSMSVINLMNGWLPTVLIAAAILVCALLLMKKQNWQPGREKGMLTGYTILLAFMTAKAIATLVQDMTVGSLLMALGAILFLVSDLLLGVWNYHTGKRAHANLNWITYFSGMMLIALSVSPLFEGFLGF